MQIEGPQSAPQHRPDGRVDERAKLAIYVR
jgi:hypothetical protein